MDYRVAGEWVFKREKLAGALKNLSSLAVRVPSVVLTPPYHCYYCYTIILLLLLFIKGIQNSNNNKNEYWK